MKRLWLAALLVVPLGACEGLPTVCTDEARPALDVTVTSATTGAPVVATVIARDGAFADSMSTAGPYFTSLWERAGTYDVTVRAAGYATWTRSDVKVAKDQCHVKTVHLDARLTPL
jgi:hypothetical protein